MFSAYLTGVAPYSSVLTKEAIASMYMANKDGGGIPACHTPLLIVN